MQTRSIAFNEFGANELALWTSLLKQQKQSPSPFLAHEFCAAVDQVAGNVFVALLGEGDDRAFLPFQPRAYMPSIADKVGGHMSDICGIIGGQKFFREHEILSAAGTLEFSVLITGCSRVVPFHWTRIVECQGIKVNVKNTETYFSNLRGLDRKFVNEVNRLEKQLSEKCGDLRFEWHSSNSQAELERLIAEKRKQYIQSDAADALSSDWSRSLLKILLGTSSEEFEAVMSTIHCGDRWIASHFGLRYRDVLHVWFPVYNQEFRRFGPGHILLFKIFAHGSAIGIRRV